MLTYRGATELLAGCDQAKLAPNTYLRHVYGSGSAPGCFEIVFHRTGIVRIYEDDTYRLDTGGWTTPTTKERLNRYVPGCVYSEGGRWYVNGHPFVDGMIIDSEGEPAAVLPGDGEPERSIKSGWGVAR